MTQMIRLPSSANLLIDPAFISHIHWKRGHRERTYVNPTFTNWFRKLLGIKPIRPHYVRGYGTFDGFWPAIVKVKVNGEWHTICCRSNKEAENTYKFLRKAKEDALPVNPTMFEEE